MPGPAGALAACPLQSGGDKSPRCQGSRRGLPGRSVRGTPVCPRRGADGAARRGRVSRGLLGTEAWAARGSCPGTRRSAAKARLRGPRGGAGGTDPSVPCSNHPSSPPTRLSAFPDSCLPEHLPEKRQAPGSFLRPRRRRGPSGQRGSRPSPAPVGAGPPRPAPTPGRSSDPSHLRELSASVSLKGQRPRAAAGGGQTPLPFRGVQKPLVSWRRDVGNFPGRRPSVCERTLQNTTSPISPAPLLGCTPEQTRDGAARPAPGARGPCWWTTASTLQL